MNDLGGVVGGVTCLICGAFNRIMLFLALSCAGISNYYTDKYAARYQWSDRNIVITTLGLFLVLALYCCIGFFTEDFGFQKGWEVWWLYTLV